MSTPLIRRPDSDGAPVQAVPALAEGPAGYRLPATVSDLGAQVFGVLGLLTGVWVALSPWFMTLQTAGDNANIVNLVSGLAVAGVGAAALASPRGFAGLQLGAALLGVWLVIAGPILSYKHPIADAMFWSNSWAGGFLFVVAVGSLAAVAMRRPARR